MEDADCFSSDCTAETTCFVPPMCDDKLWNGDETGLDCGGPDGTCPPCKLFQGCEVDEDCDASLDLACDPRSLTCE